MSLSVKNKWIDEENRVYIIFTVEEIMDLLGCGKQKAVKSLCLLYTSYKMKYEAMKHQGSKGKHTASLVGEMAGDSGRTVQRYIRLAELIPTLLEAVDSGKMPMTVGEKLSYLKKEVQQWVAYAIADCGASPTKEQAEQLKNMQEEGVLTEGKVFSVLMKKEKNSRKVTIPEKKIRDYFPPQYTKTEIEEVIYKLLEQWKEETGEEDPVNGENGI